MCILDDVTTFVPGMQPYLIGVSGGSASGKTSFLKTLSARFHGGELCIISQDNYYRSPDLHLRDDKGFINFDLPECIDVSAFLEDLQKLRSGMPIKRHEYLYQLEGQEAELIEIQPAPVVVVEGLFLFHFRQIFEQLDLKIFIDAKEEIKLRRRLQRDTVERGIDWNHVMYQWENHVRPSYEKYLLPYKGEADMVINNNDHFSNSLQVVSDHIKTKLHP